MDVDTASKAESLLVARRTVLPQKADIKSGMARVRFVPILLQNTLAFVPKDDSVALMRFAVEAIDDGAAQSRPRRVFLFISS
jgi:hypothetical protein